MVGDELEMIECFFLCLGHEIGIPYLCDMKLHILRHAETADFSDSNKDIDRCLLPMGIKQSIALRAVFSEIEGIGSIWCSEARRARQTAEIVIGESHPKPSYHLDLYLGSLQTILQKIWDCNSGKDN